MTDWQPRRPIPFSAVSNTDTGASSLLSRQAPSSIFPPRQGKLVRPSFQTANDFGFLPKFLLKIESSEYLGDIRKKILLGGQQNAPQEAKHTPPSPPPHTPSPPSAPKREPKESNYSLNTENIPDWQTPLQQPPPQPHASLAKCDITTGRVPCLNQSNDLASLDLSVLFLILPVNTSASTGPPYSKLVGLLYCGALQCNPAKNKICTNTKGSFSLSPPVSPILVPFLVFHGSKALIWIWAWRQCRPRKPLPNFLRYTS